MKIDNGQKKDRHWIETRQKIYRTWIVNKQKLDRKKIGKVDRNQIETIQNYQIENGQKLGRKCIEKIFLININNETKSCYITFSVFLFITYPFSIHYLSIFYQFSIYFQYLISIQLLSIFYLFSINFLSIHFCIRGFSHLSLRDFQML